MRKSAYYLLALLLCTLPVLGSASQITIFDNQKNDTADSWYNHVFDIDWESFGDTSTNPGVYVGTYTLWQITKETFVTPSTEIGASNPVAYHSGAVRGSDVKKSLTHSSGLSDTDTGFTGGDPFMLSGLNITDIPNFKKSFTAHLTQECGNDSIMDQVPEPATMILLGMGLLSISAIARKLPL